MSTVCEKPRSLRGLSENSSSAPAVALLERTVAVQFALAQGVPLHEMEADLDWLDAVEAESQFARP
jgi:hypothetical protein